MKYYVTKATFFLSPTVLFENICSSDLPLAGVGAENQTEEGSRKGKRDGGKTGGITF